LSALTPDAFANVLPLLRRTIATFSAPERRRLGERVRAEASSAAPGAAEKQIETPFDGERAAAVLPAIVHLLGLEDRP
jgi:hypothetical protein